MFYKHWKKIALALTGYFWAGCDDSASSAVCLYGPDPNYSSATENPVSSSSESNETLKQSSSSDDFGKMVPLYGIEYEGFQSSSSSPKSSSSSDIGMSMPLYGVMDRVICTQKQGEKTMTCEDGTVCKQVSEERWGSLPCSDDICPAYGVVQISENTYECDGKTYNEAEFHARYQKVIEADEPEQDSTFQGEMPPALYGPPCVFNGTCDDDKE